jgi:hypothetical protein
VSGFELRVDPAGMIRDSFGEKGLQDGTMRDSSLAAAVVAETRGFSAAWAANALSSSLRSSAAFFLRMNLILGASALTLLVLGADVPFFLRGAPRSLAAAPPYRTTVEP